MQIARENFYSRQTSSPLCALDAACAPEAKCANANFENTFARNAEVMLRDT